MKKLAFISSITFILLSSACSKKAGQEVPEPNKTTYKVGLSVENGKTGLDGGTETTLVTPIENLVNQLTFIIFNFDTGNEYYRSTQTSNLPGMGEIYFDLPVGNYIFIAVGSKSLFGINKYYRDNEVPILLPLAEANMQYWQPNPTMADKHYKTDDTFYAKSSVISIDGNQTINLTMQRVVGKLEVLVEDVPEFTVDVNFEATGFTLKDQKTFGRIDDNAGYEVSNANGPISIYILSTERPILIEISGGGVRKTLSVPIYRNKRTIVKGKLLVPSTSTSFKVTINDKWLVDTTVVHF
ncbi:FimB/Mfa2 family fimbrial subunit [Pedobacter panaciterrae]|uniref:FimB/Mfa2 family fimbrial subunit n=1 Tax=Pedobacter panaciterrae TaxID=363849 RepID=UPI00155DD197|nr:FimB/Mfa2 family fimbrial subunit [Pedobacter panaciterrae]NQX54179.1 FimB/Mfa2 family fimbrial subunit [Pedobacter panaciterrae]